MREKELERKIEVEREREVTKRDRENIE